MNCPECHEPTPKRGLQEKIRVIGGTNEKYEIEVVTVVCMKCQTILGVVNAPTGVIWDFSPPEVHTEVIDKL